MINKNLLVRPWEEYELIDSGDGKKLERYGARVVIRPETQALWRPARPQEWARAGAEFVWADGKGAWRTDRREEKKTVARSSAAGLEASSGTESDIWEIKWKDVRASLRLASFKHLGIFPEQAANWEWIEERVGDGAAPRVLSLFGYTGIASIAAAKRGAHVTHVDASQKSNAWAKENAARSEVPENSIRYILDDALKFVERDARRGAEYDGIILDPPAFGRGPKGEVWRIEEDVPRLLAALAKIFSKKSGSFFLLNGYAAGYAPQSFAQAVESFFGPFATGPRGGKGASPEGEFGELHIIEEGGTGRAVPSGIYVRFVR